MSHTICHRPSFTHTLSHTNFHTQLCRTPIFTYSHTSLSHTICHRPFFTHTLSHTFDAHYWKKLTCGVIRSFNSGVIEADLGFFYGWLNSGLFSTCFKAPEPPRDGRTKGPEDQRTKGPEDQGTRGRRERTEGPGDSKTTRFENYIKGPKHYTSAGKLNMFF